MIDCYRRRNDVKQIILYNSAQLFFLPEATINQYVVFIYDASSDKGLISNPKVVQFEMFNFIGKTVK